MLQQHIYQKHLRRGIKLFNATEYYRRKLSILKISVQILMSYSGKPWQKFNCTVSDHDLNCNYTQNYVRLN